MNNHKRVLFVLLIGIIISTFLLLGKFAYSFLGSDIGEDVWSDGEATASGDTLVFSKGEALSISASTDNFNLTTGNLSSTTHPKAKLMANNKTNNATASYSTGINIKRNTYKYTTSDNKPELILTVQDEAGNNITSATGLTYVTNINGVSGFDITREFGTIAIVNNHTITTTTTATHTWTYTLTFINYETDQSLNENASIELDIIYQSEEIENNLGNFAEYIKFTYVDDNTLYLHDKKLANGAEDNSYRYAGANPNNYVCFGTDVEECPDDNLYRIIGVFDDKVKLIKELSIGRYFWSGSKDKTVASWADSTLNTEILNGSFLQTFEHVWINKIADATWFIGENKTTEIPPKQMYESEIIKNENNTYNSKIGLMYAHDYGFAASSENWTKRLFSRDGENYGDESNIKNNWLYNAQQQNLITFGNISNSTKIYIYGGYLLYGYTNAENNTTNPVFYLENNVKLIDGDGSITNPYRLS